MKNKFALTATLTMVFGSLACADTYVVDPAGGGDYLTVARAARWAPEGSTVLVTAGEYEEAVRIEGRTSLTIQAMEGAEVILTSNDDADWAMVSIDDSEGVVLRGLTIRQPAMAAISVWNSSVIFEDCAVREVSEHEANMAIFIQQHCEEVRFRNCDIGPNDSGGISFGSTTTGQIHIEGCRIHGNRSDSGYGGGGINALGDYGTEGAECELHLSNTEIFDNHASVGGGLLVYPGVTYVSIKDCTFRNNEAHEGGGIFVYSSESFQGMKIDDTLIAENRSHSIGGGLLVTNTRTGTIKLKNCQIVDNISGWNGAGVFQNMCPESFQFIFRDCEFLNNIAGAGGGGLHVEFLGPPIPPRIDDSLFCGNLPEPIEGDWEGENVLAVDTCSAGACCLGSDCVQMSFAGCEEAGGEWAGIDVNCDKITCTGPIEGSCCLGTYCVVITPEECALHEGMFMGSGTLCIDSTTYCPKYSQADFDRNNKVDIHDLIKFFDHWGY